MKKRTRNKGLAILMSLAMAFTMMPMMGSAVYADSGDPDISIGPQQLAEKVNTDDAQTLWYGGRDWRVIAYDGRDAEGNMFTYVNPVGGTENLYEEKTITLFQSDVFEESIFNGTGNWYRDGFQAYGADTNGEPSELRKNIERIYLKGDDDVSPILSQREIEAIQPRTLPGYGYEWSSYTDPGAYDKNRINMHDLDEAYVWPLSHAEADTVKWSIRVGPDKAYWLRSSGLVSDEIIYVKYGAVIEHDGTLSLAKYTTYSYGVRPAFNLSKDLVLITSAAYGGKSSGKVGANALKKVSRNLDGEWKVTLMDRSHLDFDTHDVPAEMDCSATMTIPYKGAATGEKEFISAIITDEDGNVTYYGRLKKCAESSDASGEVTINLKNKYEDGDKVYLFNEQANGDEKTDFASSLVEIPVPEAKHKLDKTDAKDATCTDDGNSEYWTCNICGLFFGDVEAKDQIEKDSWVIPAKGHQPKDNLDNCHRATLDSDGWIEVRCGVCDTQLGSRDIKHPKTFDLSSGVYTYDGKAKKPAVTVKDTEKNVIKADNYSVTYKNNTNAGKATATVKFDGRYYEGSKDITFAINKAANPLTIKARTATVKGSTKGRNGKLKKTRTLGVTKVITFTKKGQGRMTYTKASGNKKITINKTNGKVTVKKGLKKGTYKVRVKVKAAGNANYKESTVKTVTFKVRVK